MSPPQLVADAMEMMRPLAAQKTLEIRDAVAPDLPLVNADSERVAQVFSNLVGNAIKFTPAGGSITLGAETADGRVLFSVTDTGPGIPPDQLAKVFAPFWQSRRKDDRGIGLGLTIAKGIVEAHGGKIWVESEVGVGTRFYFSANVEHVTGSHLALQQPAAHVDVGHVKVDPLIEPKAKEPVRH